MLYPEQLFANLFEKAYTLAEFGEYSPDHGEYSTITELPASIAITLSIVADTVIKITQNGETVFYAIETYDKHLTIFTFENGPWVDIVNTAYQELQA